MKYSLLAFGVCVSALVGCGNNEPPKSAEQNKTEEATTTAQATSPTPTNSPDQQTYKVFTYPSYAPYEYLDENGRIIGFDVDMINEIAKSQGINVQVINSPWVGMLDSLNTGAADLVISGISRQQAGGDEKFLLSKAYLHGRDAIISKENTTDINTMQDMVAHNMGVQSYTIFADELIKRKGENSPTLKQAKTSYLAFTDLVNDKVEAVYAHENILRHYAKSQPQVKFRFSGTGEGFGLYDMVVVTKKGNNELIQKINAGIEQTHKDGTYQKLHQKWFGVEPPKPTQ